MSTRSESSGGWSATLSTAAGKELAIEEAVAKIQRYLRGFFILMMQDDVANDQENPFPGKLFNKPTDKGTPGYDVYDGCA